MNVSENRTKKKDSSPSKGIYLKESVAKQLQTASAIQYFKYVEIS